MSVRTIKVAFGLVALLVTWSSTASAQSGRSVMRGYVAFEGIAYVDKQPRAKIELCSAAAGKDCGASTQTDEHGLYEINPAPLGEKWLRVTAPGFTTYEIRIYLPQSSYVSQYQNPAQL